MEPTTYRIVARYSSRMAYEVVGLSSTLIDALECATAYWEKGCMVKVIDDEGVDHFQ